MNLELNNGENLYVPDNDKKYILAKLLVEAEKELGHSPTYEEAKALPRMPKDLNSYAFYFGSFAAACKSASAVVTRREKPEEVTNYGYGRRTSDKREEILNRVAELSFREHGGDVSWLDEKHIKRDSVLVFSEVLKTFGGVRQLRWAAKEQIRKIKQHSRKPIRKTEEVEKMAEEKKKPAEVVKVTEEKKKPGRPKKVTEQPKKVEEQPKKVEEQPKKVTEEKPESVEQKPQKSQVSQVVDQIMELIGEDGEIAKFSEAISKLGMVSGSFELNTSTFILKYGNLIASVNIAITKNGEQC